LCFTGDLSSDSTVILKADWRHAFDGFFIAKMEAATINPEALDLHYGREEQGFRSSLFTWDPDMVMIV
jgi:hypothetical protein